MEHRYITENPVVESSEKGDLLNVAKSELRNVTDESESVIDEIHSNFNLAIIPAVAVFVFIILICIKCCKWFRQYTRGGNNDDKFYAVIVTDDDKEYDHVDITSESASTVYYDTVSSYASFLKRNGNDSTLGSIRTWRQGSTRSDAGMSSMSKAVNKSTETIGDLNVRRINSTSSAETTSEQLTDSPAFRHNNRFRVSFVTDARPSASEFRTSNDNIKHEKTMRSSLKKSSTASSPGTKSPSNTPGITPKEIKMIDVGTQTNKSFRYSIRKLKGHVSDSDIDERLFCRPSAITLALQSEDGKHKDNDGNILSKSSDKSKTNNRLSNVFLEEDLKLSHSKVINEISKYPFDTKVEVIQNYKQTKESCEDLDLDDDVFIEEINEDSTLHNNKNKCLDVNTSETNVNSDRERREETIFVGSVQGEYLCSYCNNKPCKKCVDPICDKDNLPNVLINPVDRTMYGKCMLVYKNAHKVFCRTENNKTDKLLIQNQFQFPETNERPPSTFSLESSGYAELSSSESSSSSP